MLHETTTVLPPAHVLGAAKRFFAEHVPHNAAFPEQEGPGFLTLRGQGAEEIALSATATTGGTRVRGSTLFYDQAVGRYLSTLPAAVRSVSLPTPCPSGSWWTRNWDAVAFDLPAATPLSRVKEQALTRTGVTGDPADYLSNTRVPGSSRKSSHWPTMGSWPTRPYRAAAQAPARPVMTADDGPPAATPFAPSPSSPSGS